jgi:FdhE protein
LLELEVDDAYLPILNSHIEAVASKFSQTNFILQFEDLLPDWKPLEKLIQQVSSLIAKYLPDTKPVLEKLVAQPLVVEEAAKGWYQQVSLQHIADEIGIDWETLSLCFQAAFRPILVRYSEGLSPLIIQDSWRREICPICAGKPDLAFLSKDNGARWLVCTRCDTEWLFFRIKCPFCGNQDQDSLSYLTNENELYRLYACERCRKYIKAIDLRRAKEDVLFPLERILTLDLDRQAREAGYEPG